MFGLEVVTVRKTSFAIVFLQMAEMQQMKVSSIVSP